MAVPQEDITPRGHLTRAILATAIDLVVLGGFFLLRVLLAEGAGDVVQFFAPLALPIAVTLWLAPKVSYRRRDALLWLIAPAGLWVFLIIAWRVANLPYRDWPPRDDETQRAQYLKNPEYSGVWLLPDYRNDQAKEAITPEKEL